MSTPFLTDSFTDAAGVLLESHTGELGATWTKSLLTGLTTGSQISATGTLRPTSNAGISVYTASGTPAAADYDVTGTLAVKSLVANTYTGVIGRVVPGSAANFYGGTYQHGTGYYLFKQVNGTYSQITTPVAATAVDGDALTLQFRGSAINLLLNGSQIATVTDTSFASAGSVGTFLFFPGSSSDTVGIHLTSFAATNPASQSLAAGTIGVGAGSPASTALVVSAATAPTGGTSPYTTRLERAFDAGTTWHAVDNSGALQYTDTGLPRSTAVSYRAVVTDGAGAAGVTPTVTGTTAGASGTQTALVVCGIDSITSGYGASTKQTADFANPGLSTGSNYPARLTGILGDGWAVQNVGVDGQTLVLAQSANREGAYYNASTYTAGQVLVLLGGINDLRNSVTPAAAYATLKSYVAARKATGWRVVVCTVHDVVDAGSTLTTSIKDQFNALLRAGWQYDLRADAIADVAADYRIGVDGAASRTSYANYYTALDSPKREHFNDRGYEILASIVATAVGQAMSNATFVDPGVANVRTATAYGPASSLTGTLVAGGGTVSQADAPTFSQGKWLAE